MPEGSSGKGGQGTRSFERGRRSPEMTSEQNPEGEGASPMKTWGKEAGMENSKEVLRARGPTRGGGGGFRPPSRLAFPRSWTQCHCWVYSKGVTRPDLVSQMIFEAKGITWKQNFLFTFSVLEHTQIHKQFTCNLNS